MVLAVVGEAVVPGTVECAYPVAFLEEGLRDFRTSNIGAERSPEHVEVMSGVSGFLNVMRGGGLVGKELRGFFFASEAHHQGGHGAVAVVVEDAGVGIVDPVGDGAFTDIGFVEGDASSDSGFDFRIVDTAFEGHLHANECAQAGVVDMSISWKAAVAFDGGEAMTPDAGRILTARHCEGVGFESGEDRSVAGGEVILSERNHLITPIPTDVAKVFVSLQQGGEVSGIRSLRP